MASAKGIESVRKNVLAATSGKSQAKLQTQAGLTRELCSIIEDDDVATKDRLQAISTLAKIQGFDKASKLDIDSMSLEERVEKIRDVVVPVIKPFLRAMVGADLRS